MAFNELLSHSVGLLSNSLAFELLVDGACSTASHLAGMLHHTLEVVPTLRVLLLIGFDLSSALLHGVANVLLSHLLGLRASGGLLPEVLDVVLDQLLHHTVGLLCSTPVESLVDGACTAASQVPSMLPDTLEVVPALLKLLFIRADQSLSARLHGVVYVFVSHDWLWLSASSRLLWLRLSASPEALDVVLHHLLSHTVSLLSNLLAPGLLVDSLRSTPKQGLGMLLYALDVSLTLILSLLAHA